jgi:repressor LexA
VRSGFALHHAPCSIVSILSFAVRFCFAYNLPASLLGSLSLNYWQMLHGGVMALTKRQFQVLAFVDLFIERHGYCPSFDEIGRNLKLSSVATVHKHINTLEQKGFIKRGYNQSRSIEIINRTPLKGGKLAGRESGAGIASTPSPNRLDLELPLLGRIAAGRPLEAVSGNESLSLSELVGKESVYVLKVNGDSMIEDHICNGDFVIVEATSYAEDGDTIVALIENLETTLKKFYREKNNTIRLQPANADMQPIVVRESDLKIQGRVIGVLRKY